MTQKPKLSHIEYNKKELESCLQSIEWAKSEYEKIKRDQDPVIKLIRDRVRMERRGKYYILYHHDEEGNERVIFARKDNKTKRWCLRENRKQLMSKCPYNLNEIRLKIATGEI